MSSENNSNNSDVEKKINYSTDYMPEYLQNSDKLITEENRIKNIHGNKNDDSYSNDGSISDYMNNDVKTEHKHSKKYDYDTDYNNEIASDEKEKEEDYDNYNELSREKKQQKRMEIMRLLGELVKLHKIKLSKPYTIDSDYFEMKNEYNLHKKIRDKEKSIKWLSGVFFSCVEGIEMWSEDTGSQAYNVKLSGWQDRINANIEDYYEVFGELYEKHSALAQSYSPEIRLLFLIIGSATMTQLRNSRERPVYSQQEKDNDEKLRNKTNKDHTTIVNDLDELEFLKQSKLKRDSHLDEMEKMKKQFNKTENEYNKTSNSRAEQIQGQLQMLRNNISRLDNNKEQFPNYNIKTTNVIDASLRTNSSDGSIKEETKKSSYSKKSKKANKITINI